MPVISASFYKLVVGALIYELATSQNEYFISPADLTETVGYQEGCSLAADGEHRLLYLIFSCAVYGAGAVIKNEYAGIGEKRPGYCYPLPLPPGKGHPSFSHFGVVAFFEFGYKAVGLCLLRGIANLLFIGFLLAECDIFGNIS